MNGVKEAFTWDGVEQKQKEFFHKVLDLGIDFIDGAVRSDHVIQYKTIDQLKKDIDAEIPTKGVSLDELLGLLEKISAFSISQSDQKFLAFPDTGNSVAGLASDMLRGFLNQNLIAFDRSAPIATIVETQLILWLRGLVGYPTSSLLRLPNLGGLGGMWTTGGNMSNYMAVLGALHSRFPSVAEGGLISLKKRPVMIVASGIQHFSFEGAALSLGLGKEGIIWAESGEDYTSNVDSIESILKNMPNDTEPFMVVAVAGNCRTSGIDDLQSIYSLCRKYNVWFHVDACHGGSLLFSRKLRDKVKGIELSDSVTLDPHKGLFVPYESSYVLFRDSKVLASFSRYPDKVQDPSCNDLGMITPFFGSRGFHSLKLWLLIKHLGVEGIGEAVEQRDHTYKQVLSTIKSTNMFVFLNEPSFYRSAFVFLPDKVQKLIKENNSNLNIQDQLKQLISHYTIKFCENAYRKGNVVFDLFKLRDHSNALSLGRSSSYYVIGMSVGHPFISSNTLKQIREEIISVGEEFENEYLSDAQTIISTSMGKFFEDEKTDLFSPASW